MAILPDLNVFTDNSSRNLKAEYLYVLYSLDVLREADPSYLDKFIAAQYLEYSKTVDVNILDDAILTQFYQNHKELLSQYVLGNYFDLILNIMSYIQIYIPDDKYYVPTPLSPVVCQTVNNFFLNNTSDIKMMMTMFANNVYGSIDSLERELDDLANMLKNYFYTYRIDEVEQGNPNNWLVNSKRIANSSNIAIVPDVLKGYLDTAIDCIKKPHLYFSKDNIATTRKLKMIANFLDIVMHIYIPFNEVIRCKDEIYQDILEWECSQSVIKYIQKYRHLSSLNINNVICANNNIYYSLEDVKLNNSYIPNSLAEKYLVLTQIINYSI